MNDALTITTAILIAAAILFATLWIAGALAHIAWIIVDLGWQYTL